MKCKIIISVVFMAFIGLTTFGQVESLNDLPDVNKGFIMLTDGQKVDFKGLKSENNTLIFTNKAGLKQQVQVDNVYKVVKTGNWAIAGSVSGGLGGLLGAISGTSGWTGDLKDKKSSFIVGATIGCAALGGIIGAFVTKEKVLYKNTNVDLGFICHPALIGNKYFTTIGIAIKL